jgi:hypothetical protein
MKMLTMIVLMLSATSVMAAPAKRQPVKTPAEKICDSLQQGLDDDCAHILCDEFIADGTYKDLNDCTSASDYAEAAQGACDGEPSLEDAVQKYNLDHPKAHLTCEY